MAKKSKRDDLAPPKPSKSQPAVDNTGRQPRIVGWLVLIVGGFSSWYWYRPLPDTVHQTVHATSASSWATSKSGPNSLWTDQTLVLPSTEETTFSTKDSQVELSDQPNEDLQLVGSPKVTLTPWNDVHRDIRDVIKTERVPMVPVTPSFDLVPNSTAPQPWTPDQQLSNRIGSSSDFKNKWPDSGYVPQQKAQKEHRRASTQITTQIPKLLETGMRSIQTDESVSPAGTNLLDQPTKSDATQPSFPQPTQPHPTTQPHPNGASQSIGTQSTRQPQFIRQPRSSN